jgi:hypothetical protein
MSATLCGWAELQIMVSSQVRVVGWKRYEVKEGM